MKVVRVTIKGISPLLMNRFPLEPITALEKKPKEEQAEIAAYRDPDTGELYIPGPAFQQALVNGGAFSKGKGRASLIKTVAASVIVLTERASLGTTEYVIDARPVVISATRGRIIRYRPRLDDWQATFLVQFDPDLITEAQLREVVDSAGSRVGLLDYRPACKGPFGRFMVVGWKME